MKHLRLTRDQIEDYQNLKLRRLVAHAYETVPFYHQLFKENDIIPSDIRDTSDLNKLPITDKNTFRKLPYEGKISQIFIRKPLRIYVTGGTTGEPLRIFAPWNEDYWRTAQELRVFRVHGYRMLDKEATVAGLSGRVKPRWFNKLGFYRTAEVPFDSPIRDQIRTILEEKPDIFLGYPSRIHQIAKYLGDHNVRINTPKAVFTESETVLPNVRAEIEKGFGSRVTDIYAAYEFGIIAWECRMHKGLHIDCDSLVLQITRDGFELENGERGNITITDLDNYAMPLIRYDIGDIGVKSKRTCRCGVAFPLLQSVLGRKWDMLRSPSGEEIPPLLVEQFVRKHRGVVEYQVVQNSIDSLNVDMVVSDAYDFTIDEQISDTLRRLFGFKHVIISHPTEIKRTRSGKLRCVARNF